MGRFLSAQELSRMVGIPPNKIEKEFDIHKCPGGYHEDVVREWCAIHGLPVGGPYNAIGIGESDDERVDWYDSIFDALLNANKFTRVLILPEFEYIDDVWELAMRYKNIRIVVYGCNDDSEVKAHLKTSSMEDAIKLSEEMFSEAFL